MTTPTTAVPTCYRHTERESYVRCTRCDRTICPDCMREAAVGFHCPECVKGGNKNVRQARTVFGGSLAMGQGTPWVTITLIVLNLAMYAGELQDKVFQSRFLMTGDSFMAPNGTMYYSQQFIPQGWKAVGVTNGEWYRLITSNYIHALPNQSFSVMHILFNMIALWQLGPALEYVLGRVRFAALYTLCGLGGSVLVYLLAPQGGGYGASGAVFGLVGAFFVLSRKQGSPLRGGEQMLIYYVVWLVISMRATSWQGHLGGLATGLALGAVIAYAPRANQLLLQTLGYVAVVGVLVAAVAVQYTKQKAELPVPLQVPSITASLPAPGGVDAGPTGT